MKSILTLTAILVGILVYQLISIWIDTKRPYYRLVYDGKQYVIQYRYRWIMWKTYILPGTGGPALFYTIDEAESMINTLVMRRKITSDLDKSRYKFQVIEYSELGKKMGDKK